MNAPTFTPGPWEDDPNGEARNVRAPDGGIVAQMGHLSGHHGASGRRKPQEVSANARLIATAPELYGAAHRVHVKVGGLFAALGHGMKPSDEVVADAYDALDALYAALAKATP
jgi:hypothetical protein